MLKKLLALSASAMILVSAAITPAAAANREGDASYRILGNGNVRICWNGSTCETFSNSNAQGTQDQCSYGRIVSLLRNNFDNYNRQRIGTSVQDIDGLRDDLLYREHNGRIYAEFYDCGSDSYGYLQGLLVVDLEDGDDDTRLILEGAYYVTETD